MAVRKWFALMIGLWSAGLSGCSFFHDLQPHRIRRLNRVPAPHQDPEFTRRETIPGDPIVRAQNAEPHKP